MSKFIVMVFILVLLVVGCSSTNNFEKLNDGEDWTSISGVIKANIARDVYSLPCCDENDLYTVVKASSREEARLKALEDFSYYDNSDVNGNAEIDQEKTKSNFKSHTEISTNTTQNEIQVIKQKKNKYLCYKSFK